MRNSSSTSSSIVCDRDALISALWLPSICPSSSSLQDFGNRARYAFPVGAFSVKLSSSRLRQFIELGSSIVVRKSPLRLYPAAFFHPVKRGIKGTVFNFERVLGNFV